jgi:hypothetical protein
MSEGDNARMPSFPTEPMPLQEKRRADPTPLVVRPEPYRGESKRLEDSLCVMIGIACSLWLDPVVRDPNWFLPLMVPFPVEDMKAYPVRAG